MKKNINGSLIIRASVGIIFALAMYFIGYMHCLALNTPRSSDVGKSITLNDKTTFNSNKMFYVGNSMKVYAGKANAQNYFVICSAKNAFPVISLELDSSDKITGVSYIDQSGVYIESKFTNGKMNNLSYARSGSEKDTLQIDLDADGIFDLFTETRAGVKSTTLQMGNDRFVYVVRDGKPGVIVNNSWKPLIKKEGKFFTNP